MKRTRQRNREREGAAAYYALNSAPAYHMFGAPDFRDEQGREYRIAFAPGAPGDTDPAIARASASRALVEMRAERGDDGGLLRPDATADDLLARYAARNVPVSCVLGSRGDTVRLWVRLPRGQRLPWPRAGTALTLVLSDHAMPRSSMAEIVQRVSIAHTVRSRDGRATGYADVDELPPDLCNRLLALQAARYTSA